MDNKKARSTSFKTDVERVLKKMQMEIYSGEKKPRERLVEMKLAEKYEVSRMVIRQVFSYLEADGLVDIEPYKGATVSPITINNIIETYEVQSMLAGYATRLAVKRLTDEDFTELERTIEDQKRLDSSNVKEWLSLNQQFHRIINRKCNNDKLLDLIRKHYQFTNYWFLALTLPGFEIEKKISEHELLVTVLRSRDGEKARLMIEEHIGEVGHNLVEHIQKNMPIDVFRND